MKQVKQENKMNTETTKTNTAGQTQSTPEKDGKVSAQQLAQHIQKIEPAKGAPIVSDPGGCRPTGT